MVSSACHPPKILSRPNCRNEQWQRDLDTAQLLAASTSAQITRLRKCVKICRGRNNCPDRNEPWMCQSNSHTKSFKTLSGWNFLAWSKEVIPRINRIKLCNGKMRKYFNSQLGNRIYTDQKKKKKQEPLHHSWETTAPVLVLGWHQWQCLPNFGTWNLNKVHHHYPPLEAVGTARGMEKWVTLLTHMIIACFFRANCFAFSLWHENAVFLVFLHHVFSLDILIWRNRMSWRHRNILVYNLRAVPRRWGIQRDWRVSKLGWE